MESSSAKHWEKIWQDRKQFRREVREFYSSINNYDNLAYLIAILRFNIAPTSKGFKVGTMVNISSHLRNLKDTWMRYKNEIIEILNLNYVELVEREDSVLVFFYEEKTLIHRLENTEVLKFLSKLGYSEKVDLKSYFNILKKRFSIKCPHEIGIFLGYPLEDVISFHCDQKAICKATGYWKCYNNKKESLKLFMLYDFCKINEIKRIKSESCLS